MSPARRPGRRSRAMTPRVARDRLVGPASCSRHVWSCILPSRVTDRAIRRSCTGPYLRRRITVTEARGPVHRSPRHGSEPRGATPIPQVEGVKTLNFAQISPSINPPPPPRPLLAGLLRVAAGLSGGSKRARIGPFGLRGDAQLPPSFHSPFSPKRGRRRSRRRPPPTPARWTPSSTPCAAAESRARDSPPRAAAFAPAWRA